MDTRGKTNAEFRSQVNKILARHESSFDQVNATLQTVLIELNLCKFLAIQTIPTLKSIQLLLENHHTSQLVQTPYVLALPLTKTTII
ncbi:hypothetical protein AB3S75_010065 [Citrus x aurantiifolia]